MSKNGNEKVKPEHTQPVGVEELWAQLSDDAQLAALSKEDLCQRIEAGQTFLNQEVNSAMQEQCKGAITLGKALSNCHKITFT